MKTCSEHFGRTQYKHFGRTQYKHFGRTQHKHSRTTCSEHFGRTQRKHSRTTCSEHFGDTQHKCFGNTQHKLRRTTCSEHFGDTQHKHSRTTCSEHSRTKGLLVFLEGIDGCGKGTQLEMLGKRLKNGGIPHLLTKEPGPNTCLGEPIRQILQYNKGKMSPTSELLLFFADRAQHYEEIIAPNLKKGITVISDRNWPSSIAYQGGGRGLKEKEIYQLVNWTTAGISPDIVFLLDLPIDKQKSLLHKRLGKRGENPTRFEQEKLAFFLKVRNAYLKMAKKDSKHWVIIDADQSPETISEEIYSCFKKYLNSSTSPRKTLTRHVTSLTTS